MTAREDFTRRVWRTALLTLGLLAALIFGILVLVGGDWIPGAIIVGFPPPSIPGLGRFVVWSPVRNIDGVERENHTQPVLASSAAPLSASRSPARRRSSHTPSPAPFDGRFDEPLDVPLAARSRRART